MREDGAEVIRAWLARGRGDEMKAGRWRRIRRDTWDGDSSAGCCLREEDCGGELFRLGEETRSSGWMGIDGMISRNREFGQRSEFCVVFLGGGGGGGV